MRVRWLVMLIVLSAGSVSFAQEAASKAEYEAFPRTAKLARDRRAELVLETARTQLRQRDYTSAMVALQELLDGPNAFARGEASVPSLVEEANRLLREMPAAARDVYERQHGAEANRLWQEARRNDRPELLREVVSRFGATQAGWFALRDLAARSLDRGEWRLAASASSAMARHPMAATSTETSWIAGWVLAESRAATDGQAARDVLQRYRKLLEKSSAPITSADRSLAVWLEKQLPVAVAALDGQHAQRLAPSEHTVYQRAVAANGGWLEDILQEFGRYDVLASPSSQPLVIGDVVVARFVHPAKVVAVDARRGKLLWEQSFAKEPLAPTFTDLEQHSSIRASLQDELQRRWFGDSVRGRLTSDGRRLFLVSDLDDLDLKPGAGSRLRNHLEAWDLATGERRWRIGSSVNEPPTGFQGLYFLGPPLVSEGMLYIIAQRELQISLWVLRASDGRLEWTLPLAETDRQQFKETGWRHVACPVTWASGRLICPTGAGCFVAVDPITRSLIWSTRFERDDINSTTGFLAADRDRPFPVRWWESWREVTNREIKIETSLLLLASPESRTLRAVDSRTGELVWHRNFAEPLFVASQSSSVLVFERHGVTSIDPANGRERWHATLPEPAGLGDWIGGHYVLPLLAGGWAMMDAASGAVRHSGEPGGVSPRTSDEPQVSREPQVRGLTPSGSPNSRCNIVRVGERWVVLSPRVLGVFDSIGARQTELTKRAEAKPDDVDVTVELARIARQLGDWAQSEALLRSVRSDQEKVRFALRETLLHRLAERPADHKQLQAELLSLSREVRADVDDRSEPPRRSALTEIDARQALFEAAQRSGDQVEALRGVLDWLKLHPDGERTISEPAAVDSASRTVRLDRWGQDLILDMLANADAETRQQLDAVLIEHRQRAIDSPDAFALQSLAEQLNCLPLGHNLLAQLSGRAGVGVGYLKTSLALRAMAQGTDRAMAAQAWYRLALLHEFRSEPLDAADCYRELRDRFADVKLASGGGSAEWLAEVMPDSIIGRELSKGPREAWPDRLPKVTSQDEPHEDIFCYQIRLQSRDPLWRRMTVAVERQGRKVRFHGAGQRGFWDVPLPKSNSTLRHAFDLHRAWGLGPLLVVQVGDDLFGIQPLDERGETNAKLLWTISVGPYEEIGTHQFLPGRLGVAPDDSFMLDRYEQPVLEVVHASPGLLCYRTRNRLIAIDPATGSRLWQRHHLPPLASISGDGEHIVLRLIATRELEVRRGFDGRLLSRREDIADPNSILLELGSRRLVLAVEKRDEVAVGLRLRMQDLIRGQTRWERTLPPLSVPLVVDESRFGVVEPNGTLRFLSLADGQELAKQEVPLPKSLTTAHVFGDDLRLFVVLAGSVTEPSWLDTKQDRGGFRRPLVNGWLHAFDRRTLRLLWTIPTKNLPLAIDQPPDAPFLLLTYKRPSDDSLDGQNPDGVLHLIDKRTGREVLYEVGEPNSAYATPDPDPLQHRFDLLTQKRRVRLDYSGE
ncbi:MAG: PQQ-binding-like beta-propeller repeat protein [Planctomycetaceae bacterium]